MHEFFFGLNTLMVSGWASKTLRKTALERVFCEIRDRDKLMIQLSRAKILEKYSERNLLYTPKESKQTLDLNKQRSAKETKYRVEEPEATWKTA